MSELEYYKEKCRLLEGALGEIAEHPGDAEMNESTIATMWQEIERQPRMKFLKTMRKHLTKQ